MSSSDDAYTRPLPSLNAVEHSIEDSTVLAMRDTAMEPATAPEPEPDAPAATVPTVASEIAFTRRLPLVPAAMEIVDAMTRARIVLPMSLTAMATPPAMF